MHNSATFKGTKAKIFVQQSNKASSGGDTDLFNSRVGTTYRYVGNTATSIILPYHLSDYQLLSMDSDPWS
jgi:hypothetical protein